MKNKLLSKLTKRDILSLPGFANKTASLRELKGELSNRLISMHINRRGVCVDDYIRAFDKDDNKLFATIRKGKSSHINRVQQRNQYKNSIRDNALEERLILNIPINLYQSKTDERIQYEKRIKDVVNKRNFQKYMTEYMLYVNRRISFDVLIGDDEDKRLAFCEALRKCYSLKGDERPVVKAHSLDGTYKYFTLSDKWMIDNTIGHIAGTVDLIEDASDVNPNYNSTFIPVRYEALFVTKSKFKKTTTFSIQKLDPDTNTVYNEEIEIDEDFRNMYDGGFFPYINLSNIDLTDYHIFSSIDKNNYKDNCFVYACIQSGVFEIDEINHLRNYIRTKRVPCNRIISVAKEFKCHFIIRRIDESKDTRHQYNVRIDTRKKPWAKDYVRTVDLLLYKNHYMINKNIMATTYYLEHRDELDEKFAHIPIDRRVLIKGVNKDTPLYKNEGTTPMIILRKMFDLNLFREIKNCELNILATTEFNNNLNDYVDLNYDEELCCKPIKTDTNYGKQWSRIYYSDYETNSTVSPHVPYLNCTAWRDGAYIHSISFTGDNINEQLLDYLQDQSLTYFHNLKYDACFFMNTYGWRPKILERAGTILQIIMNKYIDNKIVKTLTFRNSYSLINKPLRKFASMFNLDVHKEIMAYKLYTEHNIKRCIVPALEFQIQYYDEKKDEKSLHEIARDFKQLIENAKIADAYDSLNIDIMKYAKFYCKKDCIVLMKGLEKFNEDLMKIFHETKINMLNIHNYISISAIGYDFAKRYGCFNGCYELSGKPQNFILRCVSGGRTMTANNDKQYIEGRIQDFDAVSLYPSAMRIMNGVPKGKPKIIPANVSKEELLRYDTFFAEINITKIKCKSDIDYKFGHVFHRDDNGSKIFDNNPVTHFYIDKIAFMDLMEFYDFDYEFIRGYYFNEGFNTTINKFIDKLFRLRLRYQRACNPLEQTIKLLLNSIYGKSILKAIPIETKSVPKEKIYNYIWRNYNYISEITETDNINNVYVKKMKPIYNHFNLPQFGASVLSWSKHIMNRVMNTAEQHGINIYYQDTDSMHIMEDDVERIAKIYNSKYGRQLIGKQMCQFHIDFDRFDGAVGEVHSRKLIALGKKSYLDILVDENGNEGYHIRMKGVPKQCILNYFKHHNISVEELYELMYNGEEITFNLLDGANCFRKNKLYQQINLPQFNRTMKF